MIAYKFLRSGQIGPFSGVRWLDGEWVQAGPYGPITACRVEDLPDWPDDELWRVELDGDVRVEAGRLTAERGRLVARIAGWEPAVVVAWAAACARRARDGAVAVLGHEDPAGVALAACAEPAQVVAVAAVLTGLDKRRDDAVGFAVGAARAAVRTVQEPATAPGSAAAVCFIAAHAAAHAADDLAAAPRERAWQGAWLAERLALAPMPAI